MGLFLYQKMEIKEIHGIFLQSSGVSTDTRALTDGCIYVALKGGNYDGNKFVSQALSQGAGFAISDSQENSGIPNCIVVKDSLSTLQQLAAFHRRYLGIPIIGITGTNGKTTTKELVCAVVAEKHKVTATKGNLNNHIGVPLTILSMNKNTEIGIVEMGANHLGEIAELCEISQPNYGIITNIGKAHLEGFLSYENIITTKNALYEYIKKHGGKVFVNADDNLLMDLSSSIERATFGTRIADFIYSTQSEGFTIGITDSKGTQIESKLFGDYNATNIAAACTVGIELGIKISQIKDGIEKYIPSNNRSQTVKTERNTLLLDAYNANPSSMEAAIRNFAQMAPNNKMLILGAMFELGEAAESEHKRIAELAISLAFDQIYFVGEWYRTGDNCFASAAQFANYLQTVPINEAHILIKGSRGMKLETVTPYL